MPIEDVEARLARQAEFETAKAIFDQQIVKAKALRQQIARTKKIFEQFKKENPEKIAELDKDLYKAIAPLIQKAENLETKLSKKNTGLNHSFIMADGKLYRIKNKLGQGAFGKVKKVDTANGSEFALKVSGQSADQNEEQVMEHLKILHGTADRTLQQSKNFLDKSISQKHYQVIDLEKGDELYNILRKNLLSEKDKYEVALKAIEALDNLHKVGVIHNDIKAQNFMVAKDENGEFTVAIIDYGYSDISRDPIPSDKDAKGTDGFFAPEVATPNDQNQRIYSHQSDIYSLGIMLKIQLGINDEIVDRMLEEDASKRPSLQEAREFLQNVVNTKPLSADINNIDMQENLSKFNGLTEQEQARTVQSLLVDWDSSADIFPNLELEQLQAIQNFLKDSIQAQPTLKTLYTMASENIQLFVNDKAHQHFADNSNTLEEFTEKFLSLRETTDNSRLKIQAPYLNKFYQLVNNEYNALAKQNDLPICKAKDLREVFNYIQNMPQPPGEDFVNKVLSKIDQHQDKNVDPNLLARLKEICKNSVNTALQAQQLNQSTNAQNTESKPAELSPEEIAQRVANFKQRRVAAQKPTAPTDEVVPVITKPKSPPPIMVSRFNKERDKLLASKLSDTTVASPDNKENTMSAQQNSAPKTLVRSKGTRNIGKIIPSDLEKPPLTTAHDIHRSRQNATSTAGQDNKATPDQNEVSVSAKKKGKLT